MGSVSMDCVASMDCLPDELLVQILSLLPTKQAVSSSILSKRWKTLFAFCHTFDLEDLLFCPRMRESVSKFVDSSLAFQGCKHIKKFSLKLDVTSLNHERELARWICKVLERGVSELHLRIFPIGWRYFPSKVFTSTSCTTLVNLSLGRLQHIERLPSDISLPALKILLLDSVLFDGDKLAELFLAACPSLEDLTIHNLFYPKYSYVISGKTIKKLSVTYNCIFYSDDSRFISLETPSVVDLYYSDYPRSKSPHFHLDSLAKATLDLRFFEDSKRQQQNDADLTNLISGIRNVKTLHLTASAVEVISVCCNGRLPVFDNLINLAFSSKRRGWRALLPLLLERSPNLKTLVLSGLHRYTFRPRNRFVGIKIPPNSRIKILCIMEYQGSENELKHISHLLLKMECLEVVKVYVTSTMKNTQKMRLTEDMLNLPTASSNLKIQVM